MISKGMKRSVMLNKFCSSALQVFLFGCVNLSSHVTIKESGQIKGGYFYTSQFSSGDKNNNKITSKADFAFPKISPLLLAALYIITGKREENLLLADVGRDLAHHGHFPFNQKLWKFQLLHQMERTISVWSDQNIKDQLEGGPLWPVRLSWSVGLKWPVPFAKIVVPSTTLLYPTYKNNNQMHSALGQVCATEMYWTSTGHMKFPKFQTRIFVELPAHYN